jgi:hypothetical protein
MQDFRLVPVDVDAQHRRLAGRAPGDTEECRNVVDGSRPRSLPSMSGATSRSAPSRRSYASTIRPSGKQCVAAAAEDLPPTTGVAAAADDELDLAGTATGRSCGRIVVGTAAGR